MAVTYFPDVFKVIKQPGNGRFNLRYTQSGILVSIKARQKDPIGIDGVDRCRSGHPVGFIQFGQLSEISRGFDHNVIGTPKLFEPELSFRIIHIFIYAAVDFDYVVS